PSLQKNPQQNYFAMDFVANDMKFDYFIIKQWGGRFKVQGSRFRVQGSGFRVQGSGFRVQGSGFRVQGSGFRVQGSGLWWRLRREYI
ncbi:MAG: hypothetical protein MR969_07130, partial [Dialister sp.]|nr:hypothetical protein [Dialister sp.]